MPKSTRRIQLENLLGTREAHRFICTGIVFDIALSILETKGIPPDEISAMQYHPNRGNWILDRAQAILTREGMQRLVRQIEEKLIQYDRELLG